MRTVLVMARYFPDPPGIETAVQISVYHTGTGAPQASPISNRTDEMA